MKNCLIATLVLVTSILSSCSKGDEYPLNAIDQKVRITIGEIYDLGQDASNTDFGRNEFYTQLIDGCKLKGIHAGSYKIVGSGHNGRFNLDVEVRPKEELYEEAIMRSFIGEDVNEFGAYYGYISVHEHFADANVYKQPFHYVMIEYIDGTYNTKTIELSFDRNKYTEGSLIDRHLKLWYNKISYDGTQYVFADTSTDDKDLVNANWKVVLNTEYKENLQLIYSKVH